jgi:uncharacterized membrane protein (UPF0127 family)
MSQIIKNYSIPLFEEYSRKNTIDGNIISATISGIPLHLKVASTSMSQAKGYSDELNQPDKTSGILFIYDTDQPLSFWMKRVKFQLDIIFFDSNMNYINHETMDPIDDSDDSNIPTYHSNGPARFAVELQSGWCNKNMTPNCKLSF